MSQARQIFGLSPKFAKCEFRPLSAANSNEFSVDDGFIMTVSVLVHMETEIVFSVFIEWNTQVTLASRSCGC